MTMKMKFSLPLHSDFVSYLSDRNKEAGSELFWRIVLGFRSTPSEPSSKEWMARFHQLATIVENDCPNLIDNTIEIWDEVSDYAIKMLRSGKSQLETFRLVQEYLGFTRDEELQEMENLLEEPITEQKTEVLETVISSVAPDVEIVQREPIEQISQPETLFSDEEEKAFSLGLAVKQVPVRILENTQSMNTHDGSAIKARHRFLRRERNRRRTSAKSKANRVNTFSDWVQSVKVRVKTELENSIDTSWMIYLNG